MDGIKGIGALNIRAEASSKEGPDGLKKALTDFESLFINEMLKVMRQTVIKSGLFHGGSGEDIYSSLFDAELSKVMASGEGMGLSKMLMRELAGNYAAPPAEASLAVKDGTAVGPVRLKYG